MLERHICGAISSKRFQRNVMRCVGRREEGEVVGGRDEGGRFKEERNTQGDVSLLMRIIGGVKA